MKPSRNNFLYRESCPTLSHCPHPVFGFRPPVSGFTDQTGSSSWISDQYGNMLEHFRYLPFGEIWTNERLTNKSSRYTFSGKEKDEETGYSYFGARYYNSDLSIWLSVDPMAHLYPSLSPYVYCANNPIKYIDPTGMVIDPASESEWTREKANIVARKTAIDTEISRLSTKAGQKGWSENKLNRKTGNYKERSESLDKTLNTMSNLEKSSTVYTLKQVGENGYFDKGYGADAGKMVIAYSSTSTFVHEITHGGQYHNGEIGFGKGGHLFAYDLMDEVNAYRAALAYDPSCYDNTTYYSNEITPNWVRPRSDTYKDLKPDPINVGSYKSDRRTYNPIFRSR